MLMLRGETMRQSVVWLSFLFVLVGFVALNIVPANAYDLPADDEVLDVRGAGVKDSLDPESIKILVWNMFKGQMNSWKDDYLRLVRQKDLLILQEVFLDTNMDDTFEEQSDFQKIIAISFFYQRDGYPYPTGVATFSTADSIETFFQRSDVREPIIKTPKMALFTKYELEGRSEKLLVVNIHAINFVSSSKLEDQLSNIEKVIEAYEGPVIFAGDFNTWSKKKVAYLKGMIARLGMSEVSFEMDDRKRTFGNIIDYIFIRGMSVIESQVFGSVVGSDHKAMMATLRVQ